MRPVGSEGVRVERAVMSSERGAQLRRRRAETKGSGAVTRPARGESLSEEGASSFMSKTKRSEPHPTHVMSQQLIVSLRRAIGENYRRC